MKLWLHKLKNWEYWPVYVVYAPTFFLWLWQMLKFRSFKFYKYSNPSINNGGFYGDSKMEIYQLLPKHLYPKTVFIGKENNVNISEIIEKNKIQFPFIVKPNVGCRGVGVQKIANLDELFEYEKSNSEEFLIQESINLPNEIGLFYYRLPTEEKGEITSITLKKFLTIEGNGKETVEQLLEKNPRSAMQIQKLSNQINLKEILPNGQKKCLVPFGNHNRGTEFLDGKELITEKLNHTFNKILRNVNGFYYGRLDIRFNTFEELEQGINFSIIEINGAKSEPTHIYDPTHSFWYGQREILKHQSIFQKIVGINLKLSKNYSNG